MSTMSLRLAGRVWSGGTFIAMALGGLALTAAFPARAQPYAVPPTWGGDLESRTRLTGDWGGLRDELGTKGVHLLLKATSDHGQRLYIRKATLREWRAAFAHHLRALGVAANATPRHVRGETSPRKSDGIYRAGLRNESTHMRNRVEAVARELNAGKLQIEPGKEKLLRPREEVRRAWLAVSDTLNRDGHSELAMQVRRYVEQMPPGTEKEYIAARLLARRAREPRVREIAMAR